MFNHMVERHRDHLGDVFAAIADPTRRAIVQILARKPATISQIARPFPVSFNWYWSAPALYIARSEVESMCAAFGQAPSGRPMHGWNNIGVSGRFGLTHWKPMLP